ncbi:MAG: acyl-protein synthetase [Oscillospiraceae bacterium]|nr:acyl-protein synthetase [Oscillospiraceae bacterium]
MLSRQGLFWRFQAYDLPRSDKAFLRACRDNATYHIKHCPGYAAICRHLGFAPDQLRTVEDLAKIPVIPTLFFKRKALFSMPQWRMAMKVTSSGTSGKFSRIGFDWGCIIAEAPMVVNLGFRHHLVSPKPAHCVILGYKPHRSNHTGVTRTMFGLTHFSPPLSRTYALNMVDGSYVPDLDAVAKALKGLAASPFPARVIGFPSYLWFGLQRMEELGLEVKLPKGSRIILAGGWKQHSSQEVDKGTLYALVKKVLGIPEENINELFGAVEHPVFYNTCERHHFHIPIYGRVIIRDPDTLEPLPMGRVGLVNLISPLMTATPTLSVMTDDLGYLTPGEECGCGISSPYLTILGRVGMADIQTCAAGASELLGKGEAF